MKNRKMSDGIEEATASMTDQARDAFTTVNNSMMKAMDQNRAIVQNLMKAMQEESLRFMNTRLEHTSRAFEKGRECQGLSQFIALQQDWLMDAARDYAELNKRFSEVLQEVTEQTADHANEMIADASRAAQQRAESANDRVAAE
ncbi:MAG TPA: phasin family protein [Rhizomicrobium sp.]|nr:phasin family protein [Rhizomicrobium sp.]